MGRVRYVKSTRDLERDERSDADSSHCSPRRAVRSIHCVYETDAEVTRALVPKPLEASVQSEVCVSFHAVATRLSPDVTVEIRSACFGVRVDYDDKPGNYLLTKPSTSERKCARSDDRVQRKSPVLMLGERTMPISSSNVSSASATTSSSSSPSSLG